MKKYEQLCDKLHSESAEPVRDEVKKYVKESKVQKK